MKAPINLKTLRPVMAAAIVAAVATGCAHRRTAIIPDDHAEVVSGFSQDDVKYVINRAVYSILSQDRIKVRPGSNRVVMVIDNIKNDTSSLGSAAEALSLNLGQMLRKELTNKGRVLVYNPQAGQYAPVQVQPEFHLTGSLVQRNMRKDNGDYYKEYALNLTLIDLATGTEFWQDIIPLRKVVDRIRVMD